ncbi:MAG: NAD(P)/FAD-dependent oxidoreductase [Acidobacteriota bacterium]
MTGRRDSSSDRSIDRRQFLQRLSWTASSLAATGLLGQRAFATAQPKRIVIVGAGLAGLAAGLELDRAGVEVVIVEAQGRPGGRIQTLRDDFADGFFAEAGGDLIGGSYRTLMGFVHELGLSVVPLAGRGPRSDVLVVLGDQRFRLSELRRDPSLWPLELTDAERRVAPFGLLGLYVTPLAREIGDPARVLDDAMARYDAMSLHDLLVERGASPAAIRMIEIPLNYNSTRTVSALSVIRDTARRLNETATYVIAGGNDRLPQAMAERLRQQVRYRTSVRRIEQHAGGVRLAVEQHSRSSELEGDAVIVTLPFTALRDVEMPGLPEARANIIRELPYTQISKTFIQTRSRFWRDEMGASAIWTDSPFERTFDISKSFEGPRGLLVGWVNGTGVEALENASEAEISARTIDHLRRSFPEHADTFEGAHTVHWGRTYARGAYAHFAPGQLRAMAPLIAQPIGRIHFAGEHTELVAPGMEGALVSGLRAAQELLKPGAPT